MNLLSSPWTGQALAVLLLVCSVATLAAILATLLSLRLSRQAPASLAGEFKQLFRERLWGQARLLCEGDSRLLCVVARDIMDARDRNAEQARGRAMDRAAALWQTRLAGLGHLGRVSVIVGLLASTRGLALALGAPAASLGTALAEALVPLAAGLAVALAASVAQAAFHLWCARLLDSVDRQTSELVALLSAESDPEDES
ncbi:MAG TPA: MotA/TolQ/ExbB proton channel family protein [Candidatus Brocadiia bacterium]|nr:MotA/TolQ/ExbB proton channel family protein [Candidatus Brocadiia bacterium]